MVTFSALLLLVCIQYLNNKVHVFPKVHVVFNSEWWSHFSELFWLYYNVLYTDILGPCHTMQLLSGNLEATNCSACYRTTLVAYDTFF